MKIINYLLLRYFPIFDHYEELEKITFSFFCNMKKVWLHWLSENPCIFDGIIVYYLKCTKYDRQFGCRVAEHTKLEFLLLQTRKNSIQSKNFSFQFLFFTCTRPCQKCTIPTIQLNFAFKQLYIQQKVIIWLSQTYKNVNATRNSLVHAFYSL